MESWPRHPSIYEINTWVWLGELGRGVTLASVPDGEWDAIAALGFDAVWFMGVWQRSPAGREIAARNADLQADFRRALPDFRGEDNAGSPYCVRDYVVDPRLVGTAVAGLRVVLIERCWPRPPLGAFTTATGPCAKRSGWADNPSWRDVVGWCWRRGEERFLVAVKLSERPAQAQVRIPWEDLAGRAWQLHDLLSHDRYERDGDTMRQPGLYVGLPPWGFHLLRMAPR